MLESMSSKAILTKIKAMYGRMLSTADYELLLHKTSVPACASFLKNQTYYKDVLRDIQETQIHRGALEALLTKQLFVQYARLSHYAGKQNRFFGDYQVSKLEVQCIINCVRLFDSKSQNEFMQSVPGYVVPFLSFDVLALGSVHTYDELLRALQRTPYHKVLEPLRPHDGEQTPLPVIEHALYEYYYNMVFGLIDRYYQGETAKELRNLFVTQAQLYNIQVIYRLKCYFGNDAQRIQSLLLRYKGHLPARVINALIHAPDAENMLEVLASSHYRRYFGKESFHFIEYSTGSIRVALAKKYLTFSQHSATVYIAFMMLREMEIENLTNIIEGVRYGLDIVQIRSLLILGGAA